MTFEVWKSLEKNSSMAWRTLLALAYVVFAEREGVETSLVQASDSWAVLVQNPGYLCC